MSESLRFLNRSNAASNTKRYSMIHPDVLDYSNVENERRKQAEEQTTRSV